MINENDIKSNKFDNILKILKNLAKNINYLYNLIHKIEYRQRSDEDGGRDIILSNQS